MAEYRPYLMRLSSRSLVEPNFIRLILTGDEVRFPQPCLDRRIKLLFIGKHPNPALTDPKVGDGWYQLWLDDPARPEMRTPMNSSLIRRSRHGWGNRTSSPVLSLIHI